MPADVQQQLQQFEGQLPVMAAPMPQLGPGQLQALQSIFIYYTKLLIYINVITLKFQQNSLKMLYVSWWLLEWQVQNTKPSDRSWTLSLA